MAEEIFKYLFTPISLGPVVIPNRIVSTPVSTNFATTEGLPSERHIYFHAEKAKGGVGLIEIEAPLVMPEPYLHGFRPILGYDKQCIPGLARIADAIHVHGSKVFCELVNIGVWGSGKGPSAVPGLGNNITAAELTIEEITGWVECYGNCVRNINQTGIDGVEIHACHGLAANQFLSPLWNHRTDRYGGSLENRFLFLRELIECVRAEMNNGMALGVRLNADEMFPGGNTIEDMKRIAQMIEETRQVDYLSIDIGIEPHQLHIAVAPLYAPVGYMLYGATAIKEALNDLPVIAVGRITDPLYAEKVLANGQADLVGMTRATIADPELPNKAREGRFEDIRPCLGDNENCVGRLFVGAPLQCTVNPTLGEEMALGVGTLKAAKMQKRVLIVGGGVAGMEAARVAAMQGHAVSVYEKENTLGGQVNLAAKLPGRNEIEGIGRWLRGQVSKLGVDIKLGHEITADEILAAKPDAVVLATGASYYRNGFSPGTFAPIAGWEQENVTTPEEILSGRKEAGSKIVIQDETRYIVGPGLAEWLADQGKQVEILTSFFYVGADLLITNHLPWVYSRILPKVTLTPQTLIREISGNSLKVINVFTHQERVIEGIDTVVLITGKERNDSLYKALRGKVSELYIVGDSAFPHGSLSGIGDAIRDGHRVGRLL
ncbi:MAG: FAD-dependent oxidoreductase [Proteobacteria bacterium]|nr:FAD-dependent oxidoreductase [Pseudomonadota bacterium]